MPSRVRSAIDRVLVSRSRSADSKRRFESDEMAPSTFSSSASSAALGPELPAHFSLPSTIRSGHSQAASVARQPDEKKFHSAPHLNSPSVSEPPIDAAAAASSIVAESEIRAPPRSAQEAVLRLLSTIQLSKSACDDHAPQLMRQKSTMLIEAEQRQNQQRAELQRRAVIFDQHRTIGNALFASGRLVRAVGRYSVRSCVSAHQ